MQNAYDYHSSQKITLDENISTSIEILESSFQPSVSCGNTLGAKLGQISRYLDVPDPVKLDCRLMGMF